MIVAVVPACGRSTRMGRPKLTLPLGECSVIERVVAALRAGGADTVVVVAGPHVPKVADLAEAAGAVAVRLAEETADMRATVLEGLRWIEDHLRPNDTDAFLLAPGDHPTLDASLVRRVLAARLEMPARSVVVPVCGGKRGHPTLIGWRHVAALRALPAGFGLNTYLRTVAVETREVEGPSTVLDDLDTPEDYERLQVPH